MNTAGSSTTRAVTGGFTLVELMIVVAIIGIIGAIAYPSYQRYVRESNRSVAHTELSELAARQERFFSNNNTYGALASEATADCTTVAMPVDGGGNFITDPPYYAITITLPSTPAWTGCNATGSHATQYTLTATALPGTPQASDAGCTTMTLTSTGTKGPTDDCWR